MISSHRVFLLALFLFACSGGHTPTRAFQQAPPSSHDLLVNLVRKPDEILVFKRDTVAPGGWSKQPTLDLKAARDAKLFRALQEAEVNKSRDLDPSHAAWRFEFIEKSARSKKPGVAYSDGKILNRRGDACIILPAEWLAKMK